MGFVDYHAGDFGNLEIMKNVVANKPYSVAGHVIVTNKPYSVPGNITGIFDSSKHQVTLYSQNHIALAKWLPNHMINHGILILIITDYWKNLCYSRVRR